MLIPYISAMADAAAVVVDKIILGKRKMELHVFLPMLFLFLFFITVLLVPIFGWVNKTLALDPQYLFLFLLMIALAITWNIFYYQSIQKEKLYNHELIIMLAPAMTVILASIFFPEDYDIRVTIAALVAAGALIYSKVQKSHFVLDRTAINLILAVLLMSMEIIIIKELLRVYSPVALYAFRTAFVFLFFYAYYQPKLTRVCAENFWWVMLSALLGVIFMVLRFYAYRDFGVVHTTLILILGPFLVYLSSGFFFKEKIKFRTITSAIIILMCIVYVMYIDKLNN